ncbi:MAG TPA: ribose 5-phosphate isomerase B [Bacteroidia bacterium]|jgi:ribose 5-phosphate isomerase B|nr:ribose 5-phosphate isomerase B [Bacteroidia bacterium]
MKIAIGADHAGYELKEKVKTYLIKKGLEVKDFGANSPDRVDYPDFAHPVASAVENKQVDFGIVICGSGNGVNMSANRHHGVRSALCWMEEIAVLARQHNDANVMALPARYMDEKEARKCVDAFLNTPFEGGRHTERVHKIEC